MTFFKSKKRGEKYAPSATENILDKTLYTFPNGKDKLSVRNAMENCVVTGGIGSGKSSSFAKQYFQSMVKFGMGGLIINVKSDADEEMLHLINQVLDENNTL